MNWTRHPSKSAASRLRGRPWMELRALVLRAAPLCVACQANGVLRPATQVDHIVPLARGGTDEVHNLQGLCRECHDDKSVREFGNRRAGCDERGVPNDAGHHWRK